MFPSPKWFSRSRSCSPFSTSSSAILTESASLKDWKLHWHPKIFRSSSPHHLPFTGTQSKDNCTTGIPTNPQRKPYVSTCSQQRARESTRCDTYHGRYHARGDLLTAHASSLWGGKLKMSATSSRAKRAPQKDVSYVVYFILYCCCKFISVTRWWTRGSPKTRDTNTSDQQSIQAS